MRISEAVQLILEAGRLAEGGEVFILKIPAVNILDLALALRARMIARKECKPGEIIIEEIGKRRGEKLYEELLTDDEVGYTKDNGKF